MTSIRKHGILLLTALVVGPLSCPLGAGEQSPEILFDEVGIEQRIGERLPLDVTLRNEQGDAVSLGELLDGRPALLSFAYYECPMLCTYAIQGLVRSLKTLPLEPGTDFEVLVVSIDPEEGPELAAAKKVNVLEAYGRPDTEDGWHFLTADAEAIARLTKAAGFGYERLQDGEYAHGAAVIALSPEGVLTRYLLGIDYPARDLRLSLTEASNGETGSIVDRALLLCYSYDPNRGRYTFAVMGALRAGAIVTLLGLGGLVVVLLRREPRRARGEQEGGER